MSDSKQAGRLDFVGGSRRSLALEAAAVIAIAVFAADILTNLYGAIAVLYVAVPLVLAPVCSEGMVIRASLACGALTVIAFLTQNLGEDVDSAYTRFGVSLAAIAVTTVLVLRNKRSAEARQQSERRYGAIFHAAGFATWESDWSRARDYLLEATNGVRDNLETWLRQHPKVVREATRRAVMHEVNQAAVALLEAPKADDLIGSVIVPYPSGSDQGFAKILSTLLEGADRVEAEVPLRTFKGRRIEVILRVTVIPGGRPWSRALVMAFDETERKEARAKLEQASAELARAARVSVLGQLAASVAHEVNQPLTAIAAYGKSASRWLDRDTPDVKEARDCLDKIVANGTRAGEVIARIHSLARKAPPKVEPLDMAGIIYESVALVAHEARSADTVIGAMLSDMRAPMGDRVQIQQVLVNLLINSIQAMQSITDRQRQIVVSLTGKDEMICVEVQDCGTGIENSSRIFSPFFTTKQDGMGMGLSICRSIIEAQGGRINARNNEDFGATFSFTLPVATAQPAS